MQKIENSVWRQILGAPSYAPIVTLRGEIGASGMIARDMKAKIMYEKYLRESDNGLIRKMYENIREWNGSSEWMKITNEYKRMIGLKNQEIDELSPNEIKEKIYKFDLENWREEMRSKKTLNIYNRFKMNIGQEKEDIYENDYASILLFRARTNTLQLGWRQEFVGGQVCCRMCDDAGAVETLEHFLKECRAYTELKRAYRCEELTLEEMLLFDRCNEGEKEKRRDYIERCWRKRREKLEEQLLEPNNQI